MVSTMPRATMTPMLPTDNHVHTRWSWDTAASSSMEAACARAVELGLPGVAFTEHLDFTQWGDGDVGGAGLEVGHRPHVQPLDVAGYSADVARCRESFPELRILSGVEAGEPHRFPASVAATLATGTFDRVLGSLHAIECDGALEFVDRSLFDRLDPHDLVRRYFAEMLELVRNSEKFGVLAHCDYPRRYWPTRRAAGTRDGLRRGVPRGIRRAGVLGPGPGDQHPQPPGLYRARALVAAGGGRCCVVRQRRPRSLLRRPQVRPCRRHRRGGRLHPGP